MRVVVVIVKASVQEWIRHRQGMLLSAENFSRKP